MLSLMRLFTGLSIPPQTIHAIDEVLKELRATAQLRWSPLDNLHITSKFIGEWPESRLAELQTVLAALDPPGEFEVTLARFGFLPNLHRPKIFFAGVNGEMGLTALAERTDSALAQIGVKREDRAYTPHLTLARIRDENIGALSERIAARLATDPASCEFGSFNLTEFHLYSSKPGPAGSVYSRLASFPLQKATS
jgi:2'-5' RNA ligase